MNRPFARWAGTVIVDDDESALRDFFVEGIEGVHGRFIQIAIEAKDSQLFDWGGRQRVLEPAFEETDLIAEQAITGEEGLHLLEADCQDGQRAFAEIEVLVFDMGWRWNTFEGVSDPYDSINHIAGRKDAAHENRRAAAPD